MKNFDIVRSLMVKDNSLDSEIMEMEANLKRDITIDEENKIISDMVSECEERMADLSCSLIEAYRDIMQ